MDKNQISRLNAARSVLVILARWKDSLPEAAQDCQTELSDLTNTIMEQGRQQNAKQGLTAQKAQSMNSLADAAVIVAGALCSYGTAIGDDRLVAACDYSRTDILAGPDARITARCSGLHDEATAVVEELAKYKVTATSLKAFKAKIDGFHAVQTSPRDGIAQSAAATRRLPKLFRKVSVLLSKRLDPLIAPFKETEPTLFNEYRVARKLVKGPSTPEDNTNIVSAPGAGAPVAKAA